MHITQGHQSLFNPSSKRFDSDEYDANQHVLIAFCALFFLMTLSIQTHAEPYLSVKMGMHCHQCHVNNTGGGLRNDFAQQWSQIALADKSIDSIFSAGINVVSKHVDFGFDARGQLSGSTLESNNDSSAFVTEEILLYLNVALFPDFLSLYVDEQLGPGGSRNREALAQFQINPEIYLKLGRFFIPYGLRLEDDDSLIRSATGVNFFTPDDGFELGWHRKNWFAAFALTNGQNGGIESEKGKQANLFIRYLAPSWQLGASAGINSHDSSERKMANIMLGLKTGPVYWLAEIDQIEDRSTNANVTKNVYFLEANVEINASRFLKISGERLDPDNHKNNDHHYRYGIRYAYFPMPSTELTVGVIRNLAEENSTIIKGALYNFQLHLFY